MLENLGWLILLSLKDQVDIFDIFHDGIIIAFTNENGNINLEIEIHYLAELLNPQFNSFKVQLLGCKKFSYKAWDEGATPITDLPSVNMLSLGILSAKANADGSIVVSCWNNELGGELTIKTDDIIIYDQSNQLIDLPFLAELCDRNWSSFKN